MPRFGVQFGQFDAAFFTTALKLFAIFVPEASAKNTNFRLRRYDTALFDESQSG